jgi:regulator of sigma E protease
MVAASPLLGLALVCFGFAFAHEGYPTFAPSKEPVVSEVVPGMPAESAGLRPDDRIVKINDIPVSDFEQLRTLVQQSEGATLRLLVERNGERRNLPLTPRYSESMDAYLIGIRPPEVASPAPPPLLRAKRAASLMEQSVALFSYETRTVGGPVMIGVLAPVSNEAERIRRAQLNCRLGLLISLQMLLLCLMPVPFLDGRRILFATLHAAIKRPGVWRVEWWYDRILGAVIVLLNVVTVLMHTLLE